MTTHLAGNTTGPSTDVTPTVPDGPVWGLQARWGSSRSADHRP